MDHAVANIQLLDRFGCLGVEVLTATRSNHQPIIHAIQGFSHNMNQRRRVIFALKQVGHWIKKGKKSYDQHGRRSIGLLTVGSNFRQNFFIVVMN